MADFVQTWKESTPYTYWLYELDLLGSLIHEKHDLYHPMYMPELWFLLFLGLTKNIVVSSNFMRFFQVGR